MRIGLKLLVPIAAALFATPAPAQTTCYGPLWREFTDPRLGITLQTSASLHQRLSIDQDNFVIAFLSERARQGQKIDGPCSNFKFDVIDYGNKVITNPAGLLKLHADIAMESDSNNQKVILNRTLNFQGSPAREVIYTFNNDYTSDLVVHRYLLVLRGNKFYSFFWYWDGDREVPAEATHNYDSIRFTPVTPDPHVRSQAMLVDTIIEYWWDRDYPTRTHMSPSLRQTADQKRRDDSKVINGFGYVQKVEYLRTEIGYRVFRIEHNKAVVDWYITDDGNQISRLTWRKIRDI